MQASDATVNAAGTRPTKGVERYRDAVQVLGSRQKTSKGAPAYSRFVNRRLGRHLAAAAWALDLTPNQVTALSATCTFAGILTIALVPPTVPVTIVIALALVLGYALDSADGQLARLRGGGSSAGEWLDHVIDAIKAVSLHAAVLVSLYRFSDLSDRWLLVPLLFSVISSSWFFAMVLTDLLRRAHVAATGRPRDESPRRAPLLRSLLALPIDYGMLCLVFLLLSSSRAFITVYGLMLAGSVVLFAASLRAWFRELSAHDEVTA